MIPDLRLETIDRDGALLESLGELHGRTRADFLRGALLGSAALFAAFATPASAEEDESPRDISILNFVLNLEELQAVFYTETERNKILHGALAQQSTVVGSHERAHARALREVLGSHAIKRAHFDFGGTTEDPDAFRRTAVAFEDLSVAAYKAQAPKIVEREYLVSALAIHSVEARHAAWIRRLAGKPPVQGPFDEPISRARTTQIVDRTHFVMAMTSTKGPKFTG
jgi:Ferritin-like domain